MTHTDWALSSAATYAANGPLGIAIDADSFSSGPRQINALRRRST